MENYKMKHLLFIYYGVFMFLSLQVSHVSSAGDTISTTTPLHGLEEILSRVSVFKLGLIEAATDSGSFHLGISYYDLLFTQIVWVANRESPIRDTSSITLKISYGNLILYDNTTDITIWSTGLNSSSNVDVQAVLLDSGNLVLRNGSNSSAALLWQSFDHPSDTWLPGAKLWCNKMKLESQRFVSWKSSTNPSPGRYSLEIDPSTNNSLVTVWNRSKSYWSSGPWNDELGAFKGVGNRLLRFKLNMDKSYITYSLEAGYGLNYFAMDVSGQLRLYFGAGESQKWGLYMVRPNDICEVYKYCGSFGICNGTQAVSPCRCVPGFLHLESDPNDFSGGCRRQKKLQCGKGNDEFLPLQNIKLAINPITLVLPQTPPLATCASACLANCSCQAYAYDGNKCLIWTKDAFNLQQLDGNKSKGNTLFIRVAGRSITTPTSNLQPPTSDTQPPTSKLQPAISNKGNKKSTRRRVVLPVVLSSVVAGVALFVGFFCYISHLKRTKRTQKEEKLRRAVLGGGIIDVEDGEHMCCLNLHDIMVATNSFSEENKLGEGGFGPVYKGKLKNGMDVAIKRLSKKSSQGLTEFKNEVVLIIKLQHKNLVRLLGYCVEYNEKLLIYEYMSNKSLDSLLFDPIKCRELDWEKRMNIVNGTTKGLQYLHEDSRLKIIHRDLKASNILLGDEMNPKISDFGTARIFGCNQVDDSTEKIVGTFGYMSPEYALRGIISEKSDIYSFGVLLLEIISGKKATKFVHNDQKHSLVAFAWESWCETQGVCIIEEALCGSYSLKEAMRCVHIALLCVQDHPKDRPTISQIIYMLSNDNNLPNPKQPTFSNVLNSDQQLASDYVFSINEATQTEIEAR